MVRCCGRRTPWTDEAEPVKDGRSHASDTAQFSAWEVHPDTVQSSGLQAYASLPASGCSHRLFLQKATPRVFFTAIYDFSSAFWID